MTTIIFLRELPKKLKDEIKFKIELMNLIEKRPDIRSKHGVSPLKCLFCFEGEHSVDIY